MAIRNIRIDGDDILRTVCKEVTVINDGTRRLIKDMFETMYKANGVGLAGPQIGIVKRIVVIDDTQGHKLALINPVITEKSGEQISTEGCLSLPGFRGQVTRPKRIHVEALNELGEPLSFDAEDFFAVVCCHEIDHLDGILYKDVADVYERVKD